MKKDYRVFLDLDGVVADIAGRIKKLSGYECVDIDDTKFWEIAKSDSQFFYNLDVLPGSYYLVTTLINCYNIHPIILTAVPKKGKMPDSDVQKQRWVTDKLRGGLEFRIGPYAEDKHKHCHYPTDILIDDKQSNIDQWVEAGGIGVLHTDHPSTWGIMYGILGYTCTDTKKRG